VRTLRVTLCNKTLPRWAKWMVRAPALQCRAAITFHHLVDRQDIFGKAMDGRWASAPEPVPIAVAPANPQRLTENELSDFSRLWHDGCVKAIIEAQDVDRNHSAQV